MKPFAPLFALLLALTLPGIARSDDPAPKATPAQGEDGEQAPADDDIECEENFATGSHLRKIKVCTTAKQRAEQQAQKDADMAQMRNSRN